MPSNNHRYYMSQALKQAQLAAKKGEVPVGAILVNQDTKEIIVSTHNLCETNRQPTDHAEILALQAVPESIKLLHSNLTLYITLEPCPMCAGAIQQCRIKQVVYGADDPKAGACGSVVNILQNKNLDFQPEVIAGVNAEECSQLLTKFFKNLRQQR